MMTVKFHTNWSFKFLWLLLLVNDDLLIIKSKIVMGHILLRSHSEAIIRPGRNPESQINHHRMRWLMLDWCLMVTRVLAMSLGSLEVHSDAHLQWCSAWRCSSSSSSNMRLPASHDSIIKDEDANVSAVCHVDSSMLYL